MNFDQGGGHNERELRRRIIERSVADDWPSARAEWALETIFHQEEPSTCACGHYPILEICVLRNRRNSNVIEVGNVCVKRFMGIPSNRIFDGFKRIPKDNDKALNAAAADYALSKRWISDWEHGFLSDTCRLRLLSAKQRAKRIEINQRVLANMEKRK